MSVPLCPTCRLDTARALLGGSQWSHVDYYGCERCGCVWTMPKLHPYEQPPTVIVKGKKVSLTEVPKAGSSGPVRPRFDRPSVRDAKAHFQA